MSLSSSSSCSTRRFRRSFPFSTRLDVSSSSSSSSSCRRRRRLRRRRRQHPKHTIPWCDCPFGSSPNDGLTYCVVVVVVVFVVVVNTQNTPYRGVTVHWGRPLTALSRLASLPRRTLRLRLKAQDGGGPPPILLSRIKLFIFVVVVVVVVLFDSTPSDAFFFLDSTRRVVLVVVVVCVLVIQQLRKDTQAGLSSLVLSFRVRRLKRRLDLDLTRLRLSSSSSSLSSTCAIVLGATRS